MEHRLRDQEINGMEELESQVPEDPEAEMNQMFDQSILEGANAAPIGRLSMVSVA